MSGRVCLERERTSHIAEWAGRGKNEKHPMNASNDLLADTDTDISHGSWSRFGLQNVRPVAVVSESAYGVGVSGVDVD